MNGILLILCIAFLLFASSKIESRKQEEEPEYLDFDLAGANEKIDIVSETRIDLNAMEQLATDLQVSTPDMQFVIQLAWIGRDGKDHTYDLYIDGQNTATDAIALITEREINELRQSLAYECAALSRETSMANKRGMQAKNA